MKDLNKKAKPFLRWAGSKRQLIPYLLSFWGNGFHRYIEPFVGSAALFFAISPSIALLGDINSELIQVYEQVKNNLPELLDSICKLKIGKKHYLELRSVYPNTLSPSDRAARFIFLNRYCFNGLYRTNSSGQFNVPYGGGRTGQIKTAESFLECSEALTNADLFSGSFDKLLSQAREGDFVYLDPPYRVAGKRVFNEYDPASFSQEDLLSLRSWIEAINEAKVSFVLSYAESEEGAFLKEGFHSTQISVRRNISGFAGHRKIANELIITNIAFPMEVQNERKSLPVSKR